MSSRLTEEQQTAVSCRDRDILVSAAAGSGKTRVIIERIMERIMGSEKRNMDDFLVITFTNAAADELRDRFEREISLRLLDDPSDRHLKRQLAILPRAQISTIDAFCLSIVREFSHLCDLNPSFSIVEGAEAEIIRAEALENTLETLYESPDALPGFAELWSLLSTSRDDRILSEAILDAYDKIQSHPFPDIWMEEILGAYENTGDDFADTVWGRYLLDEATSMAEHARQVLLSALDRLGNEPILDAKYSPTLKTDIAQLDSFLSGAGNGWDSAAVAAAKPLSRLKPAPRGYFDPGFRDSIKSMREVWKKIHGSIAKSISDPGNVHIEETRRILPAVRGLFGCVRHFGKEYGRIKSRRNLADFNDVSHAAVRLLCRRNGDRYEPAEIAGIIGSRYTEVLIDEFQDTNGIQTLIADMLTYRSNNLFMVGDVKQSIYRFRLAEPEIFLDRYKSFTEYREPLADGEPVRVVLSKNFRSRPEIIEAANCIFEKLMIGGFTQIHYGGTERLYPGRECVREGDGTRDYLPEFTVIDVPRSDDEEEADVEKTEAEAVYVARRIRSMLDSGFEIEEEGKMRAVRPGDIAILLRSTASKAAYFERALSMLGIESATEKGGPIRKAELLCIMSFLKVIDNAYQDIPLVGVMTSPVYRFTADELSEIRSSDRDGSMYEAVVKAAGEGNEKCARFLESLGSLRTVATEYGVDRLVRHIYSVTGLPGIYSAVADGAERRRNLMRFYEYAAAYETSGRHGISGFVSYMEKTLEKGAFMAADAPGSEAVRIMTIHKSKGMEFPVVFICDLSGRFNTDDTRKPILIHPGMGIGLKILDNKRMYLYPTAVYEAISRRIREESLAEEMRILYVAMTRAKDKLIMTCAFPKAEEKLKSVLKNGENTDPERIRSADGPSKWLIPILAPYLRRPGIWVVDIVTGEAPGKNGEGEDITKDPLAEKDQVPHSPENRELLPSDGISDAGLPTGPDLYEKMIRERIEYRYPYAVLSQIPSKITATQLRGKAYESELSEDSALMFAAPYVLRRPRFAESVTGLTPAEKGTALHLAMQFVNLDRCRDTDSVKEEIGRLREMRILSDMQAEAVDAEKILRFTESGLGERMFRALDVRREFKFSVLDDARYYYPEAPEGEKVLVQGVCDLFFEEPDGMVVVDFKTDRISEQNLHRKADEYGRQLDLYASALERMTSKRVKEKYIYFFDLDRAVKV